MLEGEAGQSTKQSIASVAVYILSNLSQTSSTLQQRSFPEHRFTVTNIINTATEIFPRTQVHCHKHHQHCNRDLSQNTGSLSQTSSTLQQRSFPEHRFTVTNIINTATEIFPRTQVHCHKHHQHCNRDLSQNTGSLS